MGKRKTRKYTARRVSSYRPKRRYSRKSSGMKGETALMLGAGLYGAVRSKLSNAISPYTSKIPAGNISDEIGMAIALHFSGKFLGKKVPLVKEVVKAGKTIEYARIGEAVAQGQLGLGNNNQTATKVASFR